MRCDDVRLLLLEYERGRLGPSRSEQVEAHLSTCPACSHELAADRVLSEVLEQRLPQHAAPLALKRRLATAWPTEPVRRPSWWGRWKPALVPAAVAAVIVLAVMPLIYQYVVPNKRVGSRMVAEAVNDHLRVLSSQHPLDIESGGMHQVKPWFEGRLDFAPVVPFLGDADFPLQGGAVGYFLDRKAAVFVFHRRLHAISLVVFRADGLPWPRGRAESLGSTEAYRTASRGFNVILWRNGELGYALISDLDGTELGQLARKLAGGA